MTQDNQIQESNLFEKILKTSMQLPLVHVDRSLFLRKELSRYYSEDVVEKAIAEGTFGVIDKSVLDKISKGCINFHTTAVVSVSALAGLPGGWAMAAAIPADIAQFYAHVIALAQKLMYVYGWPDICNDKGELDDASANVLVLFIGIMSGAQGVEAVLKEMLKAFAKQTEKRLARQALTKTAIYNITKQVVKWLGGKLTREGFSKGVGKVIPVVGAPISGTITYFTFKPMATKLQKHFNAEWLERQNTQ